MEKLHVLIADGKKPQTNYTKALEPSGVRVTSLYCPAYETSYDALVLIGGGDVDPALYGQENVACMGIERERDLAEIDLVNAFMGAGKPILAICRGVQILNVALGGTLVQHLPGCEETHMGMPDKSDRVHPVQNEAGSLAFRLYGAQCSVNSYHHQAIDRLGGGLRVTQRAADGAIEGVEHENALICGVQWHPERMCGAFLRPDAEDSAALFKAFLALGRGGV